MTGCQSDEIVAEKPTQEDGKRTITFSMNIPDFQVKSRAESETPITKIDLMLFDVNREYIETVTVTENNISVDIKEEDKTPKGKFTATIDPATTRIHFIANYNGTPTANKGDKEEMVIPNLTADANNIVYWARSEEISAETTTVHVTFLRHVAKVTVQVSETAVDGSTIAASDYFYVTDFILCNYVNKGTIAPQDYTWGFNTEKVTEIPDIEKYIDIGEPDPHDETPPAELYLAEYNNQKEPKEQVCVIIAGKLRPQNNDGSWNTKGDWGKTKYYKVLLTDSDDKPYKIIRNVNYKIVIQQMQDTNGALEFEDAIDNSPINNLYAYVMPESPSISDMDDNTLTVTPIVHLITGDSKSRMITSTVTKSGTLTDDIEIETLGDSNILPDASEITINEGKLSVEVEEVDEIKKAQIIVKWGKLSRTITVIASPQYTITAQAYDADDNIKSSYSGVDEDVYFSFYLDENYPAAEDYPDLYPIKCYIRADNLYPVDKNKNMLIDYEYKEGQYWYTYLAYKTGYHTIQFKTKLSTVNEKIEVESEYFGAAKVMLEGNNVTPQFSNLVINGGANGKVYWTSGQRTRTTVTFNTTTKPASISITVPGQMTGYESVEGYGTITNRIQNNNGTYTLTYVPASFGDQKIILITDGNIHGNGNITLAATDYTSISGTYQNVLHVTNLKSTNGNNTNITVYHTEVDSDNQITTCRFTGNASPYSLERALDIPLQTGWRNNTVFIFRYYTTGFMRRIYYKATTTLEDINSATITFEEE